MSNVAVALLALLAAGSDVGTVRGFAPLFPRGAGHHRAVHREVALARPPPVVAFGPRGGGAVGRLAGTSNAKKTILGAASETSSDAREFGGVDYGDVVKYVVATAVQYGILSFGLLRLVDGVLLPRLPGFVPKEGAVAILFAFLSLRSRIASILDNSRPKKEELAEGAPTFKEVKRPWWTPPRIAFPFIWLTITALRGISSALVYGRTGALFCPPVRALVLHLCVGDTWNTITNAEKRQGVSAAGVLVVWASVWHAIREYHRAAPAAGYVLMPSGVWISIATALTWTIWNMNDRKPLLPTKGDGDSAKLRISNLLQFQWNNIGGSEIE